MTNRSRNQSVGKSKALLWIVVGSLAAVGLGLGVYFLLRGTGKGSGRAVLDSNDTENTRAWAEAAVKRLQDAESSKDTARTNSEIARVEKEMKDSLLNKQVHWTFPVVAVADGEVKLDSFFGVSDGTFRSEDPKLNGRPLRRLYLRVYFADDKDMVRVGDEVPQAEADRLRKGSKWTVVRTVTEVMLTKHDNNWISASSYTDVVDALEPYCITLVVERK